MGATDTIKRLVDFFQRNADVYKSGSINETQLRREFLDPFFTALGWDVENKSGYADAYKDVIHKYSLKKKMLEKHLIIVSVLAVQESFLLKQRNQV